MAKKPLSLNRRRSAFTLVEALVAITVTLIMMLALSKGFVMMSQSISEGRSKMNLSDQLRGISMKLREDLSAMTAGGDPNSESSRSGYFEYYEGPISDYIAALVNFDGSQTNLEQKNPASRYGDFDDILAFTAKAKKGQWFYGEVPYPIVMGPVLMAGGSSPVFTAEEWARSVTVASDSAEIVYFMMPYGPDATLFPLNSATPPKVDFSSSVRADLTPTFTTSNTALGLPARMMLCRRVLLILPELNVPAGKMMPGMSTTTNEPMLFYGVGTGLNPETQLQAFPLGDVGAPNIDDGYRIGMQVPYQRCDLSVRRVPDEDSGSTLRTYDPIAANSLADLQNPKNRFAHTILPVGSTSNTTMPIWSLTGPIPLQVTALTGMSLNDILSGSRTLQDGGFGTSLASARQQPELGFLYPQFMRQRRTDRPTVSTDTPETEIKFEMAFSEVLATNCIAFDVKGYDPLLTQWFHPGIDGVQTYGAPGSDDVVVSPNDPGYASAINGLWGGSGWVSAPDLSTARLGGFTDLGWPLTLRASAVVENSMISASRMLGLNNNWADSSSGVSDIAFEKQLSSQLSLTFPAVTGSLGVAKGVGPFTLKARKSGRIVLDENNLLRVYQPTFDTYTARYEEDGYLQSVAYDENGGFNGGIWIDGQHQYKFTSNQIPYEPPTPPQVNPLLPASLADRGANGIDDPIRYPPKNTSSSFLISGGIDDFTEKDSSPPIGTPLKAVQITIRVEDAGANVIQQVVVDQELRLEN